MLELAGVPESISVVIPVYKGGGTLPGVIDRLLPVLRNMGTPYEVVLVNDGSPDDSWKTIQSLTARHPEIRGIDLMRNYGQHNALLCGIRATRNDIIVTIDDDGQQPPEEIPRLLTKLAEGYDVVYGKPDRAQQGILRNISSRIAKAALATATGGDVAPMVSAFRAFRKTVKPAFEEYRSPLLSIDVLLTWATTSFAAIDVPRTRRESGASNYRFRSLVRHTMNVMTGYSLIPLQLATLVGFAFTLFGIAVLAYVLGRFLISGTTVAGFPFLASIIAIFSGAQLFALGILGEYLGRMHMRTMDRPAYIVRTATPRVDA
jgi:undecaprenyl-phosphate 4-deoxy-4-formamido-L-arabinose transferase